MSKISQNQKVVNFLQANPLERFGAREIAEAIIKNYPEDYQEKRNNPRFKNDKDFLQQIVAEIGGKEEDILKTSPHIFWQDKPRPRVYWYDPNNTRSQKNTESIEPEENKSNEVLNNSNLTELQLYPLLVDYLKSELNLFCQRIDEKRSKNQRGNGGNQWLHPDIVAMQPVDKGWHDLVRTCVQRGGGQSVRL